jgi:hypothetical protein
MVGMKIHSFNVLFESTVMPNQDVWLYAKWVEEDTSEIVTIADVLLGEDLALYKVKGIVVQNYIDVENQSSIIVIVDHQNLLMIFDHLDVNVGDEIIVESRRQSDEYGVFFATTTLIEVVSTNQPMPRQAMPITIGGLFDFDPTDVENIGMYVEIRGFLTEDWDSFSIFVVQESNQQIGVLTSSYNVFETLIHQTEQNVVFLEKHLLYQYLKEKV